MTFTCQACAETITVGPTALDQERLHRKVCGPCEECIAISKARPPVHPFCRKCSWRRGGVGAWNDKGCKCKIYEPPYQDCPVCGGRGLKTCTGCDGSGLVGPISRQS